MRLLTCFPSQEVRLAGPFADDEIPEYAILSHRWEDDPQQEVDYEDMIRGQGQDKAGYKKILFCAEQASQHGLRYFWVDTCCIDKSLSGEHQKAISSMFRWYQRAKKCYVYLSDVSIDEREMHDSADESRWKTSLKGSQWFQRGWTLQELLAPQSVEFFSCNRVYLGDKGSLQQAIHGVTGICVKALQGHLLTRFSDNERFSWMERRKTTREEDKVYALLGIFDVDIPIQYGEGWSLARQRLSAAIAAQDQIVRDLHITDPSLDKKRIQESKGGLLRDVYRWILENEDFQQWRHVGEHQVLWIRGDPGKGKTMLICGIVDELEGKMPAQYLLSYFFCQATDSRINNATAVLRGLLYMLLDQQPSLVSHIERQHRHAGRALFEDVNSWVALSEIFSNILRDARLTSIVFAVDGLDECIIDLPKLLHFIACNSSRSRRVKWLVSSRDWPSIQEPLSKVERMLGLPLELNASSVSEAVQFYIRNKVDQLAWEKNYDAALKEDVLHHFLSNADGTFLWVALVCESLRPVPPRYVRSRLNDFAPGLDKFYERMMDQINESPIKSECHHILATVALTFRPVTLEELESIIDAPPEVPPNVEWLEQAVHSSGCILTIRNRTISFVHQSAKDWILSKASHILYPAGMTQGHSRLARSCIARVSVPGVLVNDLYTIGRPDARRAIFTTEDLASLLAPGIVYACSFWALHAIQSKQDLFDDGHVHEFLQKHFLHWLEALSWLGRLSSAVGYISELRLKAKASWYAYRKKHVLLT